MPITREKAIILKSKLEIEFSSVSLDKMLIISKQYTEILENIKQNENGTIIRFENQYIFSLLLIIFHLEDIF